MIKWPSLLEPSLLVCGAGMASHFVVGSLLARFPGGKKNLLPPYASDVLPVTCACTLRCSLVFCLFCWLVWSSADERRRGDHRLRILLYSPPFLPSLPRIFHFYIFLFHVLIILLVFLTAPGSELHQIRFVVCCFSLVLIRIGSVVQRIRLIGPSRPWAGREFVVVGLSFSPVLFLVKTFPSARSLCFVFPVSGFSVFVLGMGSRVGGGLGGNQSK